MAKRLKNLDFTLLFCFFAINSIGLLNLYSLRFSSWNPSLVFFKKQLVWSFLGLFIAFVVFLQDYKTVKHLSYVVHGLVVVLLLITLFKGTYIKGAKRWFSLFGFRFQPSEFAKISLIMSLSLYFSSTTEGPRLRNLVESFFMFAVPFVIIVKQPDLGTALVLFFIYFAYIVFSGYSWKTVATIVLVLLIAIPISWKFLKPYQKARILSFINPERDPLGRGYHMIQSKIAIGSGGLLGKGFKGATQMGLGFIPERHTDFAFSVFLEEWGFLGGLFLYLLFYTMLCRMYVISLKARDGYGRYLAFGIFILFASQVVVNTFMCMGLLPVVGIPLPLISYGGSSTITSYISLGLLQNIYSRRFMF